MKELIKLILYPITKPLHYFFSKWADKIDYPHLNDDNHINN